MSKIFIFILLIPLCAIASMRLYLSPMAIKNAPKPVDFSTLTLPKTPNCYLSCPKNYCHADSALSPTFSVPIATLKAKWQTMINKQVNVSSLNQGGDNNDHRQYVAVTPVWHFPDFIDVQFISLPNNHSSLAIYSRSRFGHSDFGKNKHRIEHWLASLILANPINKPKK